MRYLQPRSSRRSLDEPHGLYHLLICEYWYAQVLKSKKLLHSGVLLPIFSLFSTPMHL